MKVLPGRDEDGSRHQITFPDDIGERIEKVMAATGEEDALFICRLAAALAHEAAQNEIDPLPPDQRGERFEFCRRRKWSPLPMDDFCSVNERVPEPRADVDLFRALREFESDAENITEALGERPSDEAILRMMTIQLAWARFLAMRHPKAAGRAVAAALVPELEASLARTEAMLRKPKGRPR